MRFCVTPTFNINNIKATSWVVNALVEATPISGPANVGKKISVSRTNDDVGTLHSAKLTKPAGVCFWISRNADKVSAVSPDWEIQMTKVLSTTTGLR